LATQSIAGIAPTLGETLPLWSAIPFVGILLSIALFPLLAPHAWHRHYPKVAFGWAALFALPFLSAYGAEAGHEMLQSCLLDYLPFIILLWGLFTTAGGLVIRGTPRGTPAVNTLLLLAGTLAASAVGTTGASMLLIRPVLRANANRKRKAHIFVFFIFLVSNVGGCLTPLGDPPLFLGFLRGVPFFWTLRLFPHLLLLTAPLLVIFHALDRHFYRQENLLARSASHANQLAERPGLDGIHNLLYLTGILAAVFLSGVWRPGAVPFMGIDLQLQNLLRDVLIVAMGLLSILTTPSPLRRENGFSWEPMREVAYLFAGIFMTVIPALAMLKAGERGHLAFLVHSIREPWQYFWITGLLSSVLDNAPTYLTLLNTLLGRFHPGQSDAVAIPLLVTGKILYVEAISTGAVFMGAVTYIGNAPNFMVKSIAEEAGVAMPSFFAYLVRWSIPILMPLFLLESILFFL